MKLSTLAVAFFSLISLSAAATETIKNSPFSLYFKQVPEKDFTNEMLSRRLHMLEHHQKMGHVTMALMTASVVTAIIGVNNIDDRRARNNGVKTPGDMKEMHLHMGVAAASLISYYATAYFSMNAPKHEGMEDEPNRVWHKRLAWIHGPAMVLAPVLGFLAMRDYHNGRDPQGLAKLHKPVMFTGYAALLGAYMSMTF